jgi:hypothetical protein
MKYFLVDDDCNGIDEIELEELDASLVEEATKSGYRLLPEKCNKMECLRAISRERWCYDNGKYTVTELPDYVYFGDAFKFDPDFYGCFLCQRVVRERPVEEVEKEERSGLIFRV